MTDSMIVGIAALVLLYALVGLYISVVMPRRTRKIDLILANLVRSGATICIIDITSLYMVGHRIQVRMNGATILDSTYTANGWGSYDTADHPRIRSYLPDGVYVDDILKRLSSLYTTKDPEYAEKYYLDFR